MQTKSISLFKGYSDKCPRTVTLAEVINLIRESSVVRDHTEKHRYFLSQGNDVAAHREKSSTPCFAVAVQFEGGKGQAHIHGWTGLCLVDIDHIDPDKLEELRRKACDDPHTLLVYVTIGGHGLRILILIEGLGEGSADKVISFVTSRVSKDSYAGIGRFLSSYASSEGRRRTSRPEGGDKVRFATYHAYKGLEAPVVFVAGADRAAARRR